MRWSAQEVDMATWLTERLGLSVAIVGAPMAGVSGGELAAAVSRAGGLGMIGVGSATPVRWLTAQSRIAAEAARPFGIGLMAWALPRATDILDATIAAGPSLVSLSFGDCAPFVEPVKDAGVAVAIAVGCLDDARAAEDLGADVIVARGGEGGGHGRNEVATLPLLQVVLDGVSTPVIAAGGIADSRGLAAVLAAGAVGGWAGTAFMTCREARTPPGARSRLLAATETDTAYGRVFDVAQRLDWPPEYGGRGLRNGFFTHWAGREDALAGDDAAAARYREARDAGDFDTAVVYAGQGVALLREETSAADVVAEFGRAAQLLEAAAAAVKP
jgi:nitronate monooxygenase